MWKEYFDFVRLKPGRVVTPLFGELDFSRDDIPIEKIVALFENDFPYLRITPLGQNAIYGIPLPEDEPTTTLVEQPPKKKKKK